MSFGADLQREWIDWLKFVADWIFVKVVEISS